MLGVSYLRIAGVSYLCMSISQMYPAVIRSMEEARISSIIKTMSLILNIALNAVFIFGIFGMPRLGIKGVAIATVIARRIEVVWCVFHSVSIGIVKFRANCIFRMDWVLL